MVFSNWVKTCALFENSVRNTAMTFISDAQNLANARSWHALKHVKQGFCINVGTTWPDAYFVTYQQLPVTAPAIICQQQYDTKIQELTMRIQQFEARRQYLEDKIKHITLHAQDLSREMHALYNSRSWRVTAPLRIIGKRIHRLELRRHTNRFLQRMVLFLEEKNGLKKTNQKKL